MAGPLLREAQFRAHEMIPNSGIVTTNDLVTFDERFQIHPENKKGLGERLAFIVLNQVYGYNTVEAYGPVYRYHDVRGSHIHVHFTHDTGGLSPWSQIQGFEVANASKFWFQAQAVKGDHAVDVWAPEVDKPVAVRYCFQDFWIGNLFNSRHMPAFPFRSDDWTVLAGAIDYIDWNEVTRKR
jgi:sialate O-acetylesterase